MCVYIYICIYIYNYICVYIYMCNHVHSLSKYRLLFRSSACAPCRAFPKRRTTKYPKITAVVTSAPPWAQHPNWDLSSPSAIAISSRDASYPRSGSSKTYFVCVSDLYYARVRVYMYLYTYIYIYRSVCACVWKHMQTHWAHRYIGVSNNVNEHIL